MQDVQVPLTDMSNWTKENQMYTNTVVTRITKILTTTTIIVIIIIIVVIMVMKMIIIMIVKSIYFH